MRKKKKMLIIIIAVIVVGIISLGAVKASRGNDGQMVVNVIPVKKGTITVKIPANGVLEEVEKDIVYSETEAKVKKVEVEVGDHVKESQTLAVLDTENLTNKLEIEKEKLEQDKIILSKLRKSREEAIEDNKEAYEEAKEALARNEKLLQSGAISQLEYEESQKAFKNAQRSYEAFMNNEDTMFLDIQSTLKGIKISELNIQEMERQSKNLESNIEGVVTEVNVEEGAYIKPLEPCFIISNLNNMKIEINVSEYDISKVKVGQEVEIETDALGDATFKGVVERISPVAKRVSMGQGTETVVPVTIKVAENNKLLKPGFSVSTRIISEQKENAIVVPFDAVITEQNGAKIVYVVENNTAKRVEVQTGIESDFEIEILKGLKEGDQVILSPSMMLKDGMKVTVGNQNKEQKK